MPLEYDIHAEHIARGVAAAQTEDAIVYLDTHPVNTPRVINPAELLLSSFAACVLKNVERYAKILPFSFQRAAIHVHGIRQDAPPRMIRVTYELTVWTEEPPHRVELLHRNIRKFGTIYNTVAAACEVEGSIRALPPEDGSR